MSLSEQDAYARLRDAARRLTPDLIVDRPSVRWIAGPYAGVSFALSLGPAHALFFMPAADIAETGWEPRLAARFEAARAYLQAFTPVTR